MRVDDVITRCGVHQRQAGDEVRVVRCTNDKRLHVQVFADVIAHLVKEAGFEMHIEIAFGVEADRGRGVELLPLKDWYVFSGGDVRGSADAGEGRGRIGLDEPGIIQVGQQLLVIRREVKLILGFLRSEVAAKPIALPELEDGVLVHDFDNSDGGLVAVGVLRVWVVVREELACVLLLEFHQAGSKYVMALATPMME